MWTIFLWFYFWLMVFNGLTIYVDSVVDTPIKSPWDLGEITPVQQQPKIFNFTNPSQNKTLIGNVTTNVGNSTGSGNLFDYFTESLYFNLQQLRALWDLVTGGYAWQVLLTIGLPEEFMNFVMQPTVALFGLFFLIHITTNRI